MYINFNKYRARVQWTEHINSWTIIKYSAWARLNVIPPIEAKVIVILSGLLEPCIYNSIVQ